MNLPLLTVINLSSQRNFIGLVEWESEKTFADKGRPKKFNNDSDPWINGKAKVTCITSTCGSVQVLKLLYAFQENKWKTLSELYIPYGTDKTSLLNRIEAAVDNWRKCQK